MSHDCRSLIPATSKIPFLETLILAFLPPATKLGQGNVFTGICDSFNRGVSVSVHAGIPPPRSRHPPGIDPPGADTPQEQTPRGEQTPPWEQTPPSSRHSPGTDTHPREQTPPRSRHHPPPPHTQSMLGDTVNARAVRILLECNLVCECIF